MAIEVADDKAVREIGRWLVQRMETEDEPRGYAFHVMHRDNGRTFLFELGELSADDAESMFQKMTEHDIEELITLDRHLPGKRAETSLR